ncbi:MAG: hypothetical protein LUG98_13450, partial [Tannerellaceae bacterium]|nr:hypothetical protein [Tannerellaceae bacterium]
LIENIPGEMLAVQFEKGMEMVRTWSTWKEGCGAAHVGINCKNREELINNKYKLQQIFMNKPCQLIAQDITTIKPGTDVFWFVTSENTAATEITEIETPQRGTGYIIECGSETNPSSVKKQGQFAGIESNWTPTKVGDYIMVVLNAAGKFIELERCVGGTREINKKLQPNIPGARAC